MVNYIVYYLSKVSHSSVHLLVDRRANGGVAENDVRVIAKHTDSTVDIRGTCNHKIVSIPLVTTVNVTLTLSGEFIMIMN